MFAASFALLRRRPLTAALLVLTVALAGYGLILVTFAGAPAHPHHVVLRSRPKPPSGSSPATLSTPARGPDSSTPAAPRFVGGGYLPNGGRGPLVGVGDQNAPMLSDLRFANLGITVARLLVPYDYARTASERARVEPWLAAAHAHHVEPLVAFDHSYSTGHLMHLPRPGEYRSAFDAFHAKYPWVHVISPWNEANDRKQPTANSPRAAAGFYDIVRADCPSCTVVAADVLDSSNMSAWVRSFRRYAHRNPQLWGLHDYGDSNYFKAPGQSATARFLTLVPGQVWLTETGGIVTFGHFQGGRPGEARAARATAQVFKLAALSPRISRIYFYGWQATLPFKGWDSGLIAADGRLRPAYFTLRSYINAARRRAHQSLLAPIPN